MYWEKACLRYRGQAFWDVQLLAKSVFDEVNKSVQFDDEYDSIESIDVIKWLLK